MYVNTNLWIYVAVTYSRVYYKDPYQTLGSLLRFWFVTEKETEKGGVLVKYLFIPTRREGDRRLLRKVLFYFRVRQFSAPTVTEPLPRDLYSFFSSYILSTSLISFPQILAVWFTFLFMLFDFLTSVYPFCLYSLHQLFKLFCFCIFWKQSDSVCHWISTKV